MSTNDTSPEPENFFARTIANAYPGGEYIAPHLNDGPWYVLALRPDADADGNDVNWVARSALTDGCVARYPGWNHDGFELERRHLYVVSKFVFDLLSWHSDPESNLYVDYDYGVTGPFETTPGEKDVVAKALPDLLGDPGELGDIFTKLAEAGVTTKAVADYIDPAWTSTEEIRNALAALHTSLTARA